MGSFGQFIRIYLQTFAWNSDVTIVSLLGCMVRFRQRLKQTASIFAALIRAAISVLTGVPISHTFYTPSGGRSIVLPATKKSPVKIRLIRQRSKSRAPVPSGDWLTRLRKRARRRHGELQWLSNVAENIYKE